MTVHTVESDSPAHRSFRLTRGAPAVTVQRNVRPALVLPEAEGRRLLAAAQHEDVARGGCFSAGPAGIQLWSGPWRGPGGSRGDAQHLGSVDWSYDTPVRHYVTVYRVLVTAVGVEAHQTPEGVLRRVLALAGIEANDDALALPVPPPRDPFRSALRRDRA